MSEREALVCVASAEELSTLPGEGQAMRKAPGRRGLVAQAVGLIALLGLLLACSAPTPTPAPTPTLPPAAAELSVLVEPAGVQVVVDGVPRGVSPLVLMLPAGEHEIALLADGFQPLTETITLQPGQEGIYAPTLADIAPPAISLEAEPTEVPWGGQVVVRAQARDNVGVSELLLTLDGQVLGVTQGDALTVEVAPATMWGLAPGAYTLTARAADEAGNVGTASLLLTIAGPEGPTPRAVAEVPAASPEPSATPTATSPAATPTPVTPPATDTPVPLAQPTTAPTPATGTTMRITSVIIPTYPYTPYLRMAVDPTLGEYPVPVLDRQAYEASNPQPVPVTYKMIVLENRYLRLSILPDLGGRVYECIFKPTGHNEFYRNPVIKPTGWGPPSPPYPQGANWWLAAGGMEWGFPVEEHGYEWGNRWGYDHVKLSDGAIRVSLFTRDPKRPYVVVEITLPPEAAFFTIRPRIINPWGSVFRFKWWANAMLAPGAGNEPGPELRFVFPTAEVTVHSTGDPTLPGPGQPMSWPVYNGRDLSRLGNWSAYLGFFQRPAASEGYMGIYDWAADEGMVRLYPADVARGAKAFAAGWNQPLDWHAWTDDGSGYVELHGGLTPTFDDWYELPPGGEVSWLETWYPVAGIGRLTYATTTAALGLTPTGHSLRVGLFPTRAVQGKVTISLPGMEPLVRTAKISPASPFTEEVAYSEGVPGEGEVIVTLADSGGNVLLSYRRTMALR